MIKYQVLFIFFLLSFPASSLFSQMDTEGILSTSGTSLMGENIIIDYTMGDWTSLNMDNSNGQISNGIQQSEYFIITNISEVKEQIKIKVFPNPTIESIQIDIDDELNENMHIVLHNAEGKVILSKSIKRLEKIDFDYLSPQIYYLTVSHSSNRSSHQFKIIKVQ